MELFEMSVELYKLKALASCLEGKLEKAHITMDENGEYVFCLVDLLQGHIDALIESTGRSEGECGMRNNTDSSAVLRIIGSFVVQAASQGDTAGMLEHLTVYLFSFGQA